MRDDVLKSDYATLADFLGALAYPPRLELLDLLRFPKTLAEIRLAAPRAHAGAQAERPLARATVLGHLDILVERDLVRKEAVEQGGREVPRYAVNPPRLYALMEELRRLVVWHSGRGLAVDATGTVAHDAEPAEASGPRLVLVHGLYDGRAYPLLDATAQGARWVVGRDARCAVPLAYDPFVSQQHAAIERDGDAFVLVDLGSKNGTRVNWRLVPSGGARRLAAGDIIDVGRSRLSFLPA
ncbi:MAG TPA: FHA domain-containing protein [Candidatus Thermoplasmatota archaeon]|nr:FHA domain-containing protein [Candidatus Thermoplasmatota archaeon]